MKWQDLNNLFALNAFHFSLCQKRKHTELNEKQFQFHEYRSCDEQFIVYDHRRFIKQNKPTTFWACLSRKWGKSCFLSRQVYCKLRSSWKNTTHKILHSRTISIETAKHYSSSRYSSFVRSLLEMCLLHICLWFTFASFLMRDTLDPGDDAWFLSFLRVRTQGKLRESTWGGEKVFPVWILRCCRFKGRKQTRQKLLRRRK